jgi:hypothetical protein
VPDVHQVEDAVALDHHFSFALKIGNYARQIVQRHDFGIPLGFGGGSHFDCS